MDINDLKPKEVGDRLRSDDFNTVLEAVKLAIQAIQLENDIPGAISDSDMRIAVKQKGVSGLLGMSVADLVIYLSKNLPDDLTRSEFIYEKFAPGSALPDPGREASVFLGAGTYSVPGGGASLVLTENFNVVSWDGEKWVKVLEVPVDIPQPSKEIPNWTGATPAGEQRVHSGQLWRAVINTSAAQEPGVVAETIWKPEIDVTGPLSRDTRPAFTQERFFNTSLVTVPATMTEAVSAATVAIPVNPGDIWYVKGRAGEAGRLWAWAQSNRTVITRAAANTNTGDEYIQISAPSGAAILYVNVEKAFAYDVYKEAIITGINKGVLAAENTLTSGKIYNTTDTIKGRYYPLGGTTILPSGILPNAAYETIVLDVSYGEAYLIKGAGGINPRLWGYTNESGLLLDKAKSETNTKGEYITVVINDPTAKKLFINNLITSPLSIIKASAKSHAVLKATQRNYGDVYIAASDSEPQDKSVADFVCTGVNDEVTINAAAATLVNGGTVWFFMGTYNIDSFPVRAEDVPPTAIYLEGTVNRFIEFRGVVKPQVFIGKKCAIINVKQSTYEALDSNTQVAIIGGSPAKEGYMYFNSFTLSDMIVMTWDNNKPTISLDMRRFTTGGTTGAFLYAYRTHINIYFESGRAPVPHPLSVGIYGFLGSNSAYYTGFSHTIVHGYAEGFKLGGDHCLLFKCATTRCTHGYTFGTFPGGLHPVTLIQCVDETNTNYPFFGQHANKQPVTFIDFNMETLEHRTPEAFNKHAQEEVPGSFYGEISWSSMGDIRGEDRFWENDGSGKNFKTWNQHHAQYGNSLTRSHYAPSNGQRYYDTDLKKELVYDGDRWVKSDGSKDTTLLIGTTSQRPVLADAYAGYQFFDNSINKLIILKSSGVWVDVNGSVV